MSLWTNKERRSFWDDSEDFAHNPSGGPIKQWGMGIGFASWPAGYGVLSLARGHCTFFGHGRATLTLTGKPGAALAIAYLAIGLFLHFHYFWGISEKLWPRALPLKIISLLIFIPAFFYAMAGALK